MSDLQKRAAKGVEVLKCAEGFIKPGAYYVNIPINDVKELQGLIKELTEREAKLVTIIKLCREDYLGLVVFCRENGWDRTGKDAQESVDYIEATLKSLGIEGEG